MTDGPMPSRLLVSDALGREQAITLVREILDRDQEVDNDGRAVAIVVALDHAEAGERELGSSVEVTDEIVKRAWEVYWGFVDYHPIDAMRKALEAVWPVGVGSDWKYTTHLVIYQDKQQLWRWRLVDGDDLVMARCVESYPSRNACRRHAILFLGDASRAEIVDANTEESKR